MCIFRLLDDDMDGKALGMNSLEESTKALKKLEVPNYMKARNPLTSEHRNMDQVAANLADDVKRLNTE